MNFVKRYKFSIICFIFISMFLLYPFDIDEKQIKIKYLDKVIHFFIFLTLSIVIILEAKISCIKNYVKVIFYLSCYGFLIEILQNFTGRNFDLLDLLFDFIGSLCILFIYFYKVLFTNNIRNH